MKRYIQPKRLLPWLKSTSPVLFSCLKMFIINPLISGIYLVGKLSFQQIGKLSSYLYTFYLRLKKLLPKTYKSNPLSKMLRPWFEHQQVRAVIGINLIALLIMIGFSGSSATATFPSGASTESDAYQEISVVEAPKEVIVTTERRFQMPVELLGVSQGFHRYHPGVDFRAGYGSDIRSIADGVVLEVYRSAYGYGQSVIVKHENGYSSMYAHVKNISVESGSGVDKETVIAQIGMTGYTTGPHLHLEIYEKGKAVNPEPFLGY